MTANSGFQKIYNRQLIIIGTVSLLALAAIPVVLFTSSRASTGATWFVSFGVVFLFLVLNVGLLAGAQEPLWMPLTKLTHRSLTWTATVLAIGWMGYGLIFWPSAPLTLHDGVARDKVGRLHTLAEYSDFAKWESSLPLAFLPFALTAIASIPVIDPRSRRIRHSQDKEDKG